MKKYAKRIMALFVALAMFAAVLPTAALTALANDGSQVITLTNTVVFGSGIDYNHPQVRVVGSDPNFVINLSTERLVRPGGTPITGFSVNGGTTWTLVGNNDQLSDTHFQRLLNSRNGLHLYITTGDFEGRGNSRRPVSGAEIITFPAINPRPVAPRVTPNYAIYADVTGMTGGEWILTSRERGADPTVARRDDLEIGVADARGRVVDLRGFGRFLPDSGIPVRSIQQDERGRFRVSRYNYLVRIAPTSDDYGTFTPASRTTRVRVTSEQRPTRNRVNYRNETVRLRANEVIFAGALENMSMGIHLVNVTESSATIRPGDAMLMGRRASISVSEHLTTYPETIIMRRVGTARRPATAAQVTQLAPRAELYQYTIMGDRGSISLDRRRNYEILNPNRNRWGRLPRIRGNDSLGIRTRSTIRRGTGIIDVGYAASSAGNLDVLHGVWTNPGQRDRSGVLRATIIPYDTLPPSIMSLNFNSATNTASVELTAGRGALLVVNVLEDIVGPDADWDTANVYADGAVHILDLTEAELIDVVVSAFPANNYVVAAQLVDRNGSPLGDPFFCIRATRAFAQFDATTINDFPAERVMQLTDETNNNFMVTAYGIPRITVTAPSTVLFDEDTNTYTFENLSADTLGRLAGLNRGDKVIVETELAIMIGDERLVIDTEMTMYTIVVRSTPVVTGTRVILAAEEDIDFLEFFEFIKIDMTVEPKSNAGIAPAGISPAAMSIDGFSASSPRYVFSRNYPIIVPFDYSSNFATNFISTSVGVSVDIGVHLRFSGEFGFDLGLDLTFKYAPGILGSYAIMEVRIPWAMGLTGLFNAEAHIDGKLDIVKLLSYAISKKLAATGVGLVAAPIFKILPYVTPANLYLHLTLGIGIETTFGLERAGVVGFRFEYRRSNLLDFSTSFQSINERIETQPDYLDLTIYGYVRVALELIMSVMPVKIKDFAFAGVKVYGGLEVRGSAMFLLAGAPSERLEYWHACTVCTRLALYGLWEVYVGAKINIFGISFEREALKLGGRDTRIPLLEAYWSLGHSPYSVFVGPGARPVAGRGTASSGNGRCPNIQRRTTIIPRSSGHSGYNHMATFTVESGNGRVVSGRGSGPGTVFLYPGTHFATAVEPIDRRITHFEGEHFTVESSPQVVSLYASRIEEQLSLRIIAPSTVVYGDYDFPLGREGGSGSGDVTFTLAHNYNNAIRLNSDNTITILNAGNARISAVKAGDGRYADGEPVSHIIIVEPATVIVYISDICDSVIGAEMLYNGIVKIPETAPRPALDSFRFGFYGFVGYDNYTIVDGEPTVSRIRSGNPDDTIEIAVDRDGFVTGVSAPNYRFVASNGLLTRRDAEIQGPLQISNSNRVELTWGDSYLELYSLVTGRLGWSRDLTFEIVRGNSVSITDEGVVTINEHIGVGYTVIRISIESCDDFFGRSDEITIDVIPRSLNGIVYVVLDRTEFTFNNTAHEPAVMSVTLLSDGTPLREDYDFEVRHLRNIAPGSPSSQPVVEIHGIGNFGGHHNVNFTINRAAGGVVEGAWTIHQLQFGNRSITVPVLTTQMRYGRGQTVEYAISTSSTAPDDPTAWTANPDSRIRTTFSNRNNQTYYIFARTRPDGHFNAGPASPALRVPHTGWNINIRGNITNGAWGDIDYVVWIYSNRHVHIANNQSASRGNVNVNRTGNYAPWVIQYAGVHWNASWGANRLVIDNPIITISGHGITLSSSMNRFDVDHGGPRRGDTHRRYTAISW